MHLPGQQHLIVHRLELQMEPGEEHIFVITIRFQHIIVKFDMIIVEHDTHHLV